MLIYPRALQEMKLDVVKFVKQVKKEERNFDPLLIALRMIMRRLSLNLRMI